MHKFLVKLLILLAICCPLGAEPAFQKVIIDDIEVPLQVYAVAGGNKVIVWLPSEVGFLAPHQALAHAISQSGYTVILAGVIDALFLPQLASSLSQIPPQLIAGLIQQHAASGRQVTLLAEGDGVIPALRGARAFRERYGDDPALQGLILLSGKYLLETPEAGHQASRYPILRQVRESIFFIQPRKSPWYWTYPRTVEQLTLAGNKVHLLLLPGVRDRFYFRQDQTDLEQRFTAFLPEWIGHAREQLANVKINRGSLPATRAMPVKPAKRVKTLHAFTASQRHVPLRLADLSGQSVDLTDYQGRVVLVNFWASWCPPCVHELPSLNALHRHFQGRAFTVLGVNMAEDAATVDAFRRKTQMAFTIVMDGDGKALKQWRVYAFPTSFLLDKHGDIQFAAIGAIDWMDADVIEKIETLLHR